MRSLASMCSRYHSLFLKSNGRPCCHCFVSFLLLLLFFIRNHSINCLVVTSGPKIFKIFCFACLRFFSKSVEDRNFKFSGMVDTLQLQCLLHILTSVVTSSRQRKEMENLNFLDWIFFIYIYFIETISKLSNMKIV